MRRSVFICRTAGGRERGYLFLKRSFLLLINPEGVFGYLCAAAGRKKDVDENSK
jgi:hypothetical protein